jgi:hypothetical protein
MANKMSSSLGSKSPTRRKYKSKWIQMSKEELRDINVEIYGNRRKGYYTEGFRRSCLGSSSVVVTLRHRWSWDHYLLIDSDYLAGSRVSLGITLGSWSNLAFRAAATAANKFFARIGRLEL